MCSPEITVQSLEDLAPHLCPQSLSSLNGACFGFVNWLCSLWPCYFYVSAHLRAYFHFAWPAMPCTAHADAFVILSAGAMPLFIHQAMLIGVKGGATFLSAWTPMRSSTCHRAHLEAGWRSHASCKLLCSLKIQTLGPPLRAPQPQLQDFGCPEAEQVLWQFESPIKLFPQCVFRPRS